MADVVTDDRPLTLEDLVRWFEAGEKPASAWRVGARSHVAVHDDVVAHASEQSVRDARCAARAPRDLVARGGGDVHA